MEALGELQQVRAAVLPFQASVACSTLGVWVRANSRRTAGTEGFLSCLAGRGPYAIAFATE